eukprot:SAG11_NODE_10861_length_800_cov_2.837375_2_plen_171_part_00
MLGEVDSGKVKESRNADGGVRTPGLRLILKYRALATEPSRRRQVKICRPPDLLVLLRVICVPRSWSTRWDTGVPVPYHHLCVTQPRGSDRSQGPVDPGCPAFGIDTAPVPVYSIGCMHMLAGLYRFCDSPVFHFDHREVVPLLVNRRCLDLQQNSTTRKHTKYRTIPPSR